jgi:OmpA-OmpF porin, OOP family
MGMELITMCCSEQSIISLAHMLCLQRYFQSQKQLRIVMNNNTIRIAVACTLCSVALSVTGEEMYRGAWYALPGASILRADSNFEAKQHGGGFFLKLGNEVSTNWDIQGGLSYNRSREDTGIAGVGGHYKQLSLGADALYMFSRESFRPFLLVGAGIARNNVDYSNLPTLHNEMRTSWTTNVGFGAQWLITEMIGLQADIRHQWSRSDAKALAAGIDTSGTVNNTLLNLGVIFRFGGEKSRPIESIASNKSDDMPTASVVTEPKADEKIVAAIEEDASTAPCKALMETVTISAEKLFSFDKIEMNTGSKPLLDEIVTKLKANPEFELVMVTGHTDRIGSTKYNQQLSEQRAMQVTAYLVSEGIDANRLKSVGKGEDEPKVSCEGVRGNKLIECLQPNRRVVIQEHMQHQIHGNAGCK